jgi:ketosteroid isomerase-like protein
MARPKPPPRVVLTNSADEVRGGSSTTRCRPADLQRLMALWCGRRRRSSACIPGAAGSSALAAIRDSFEQVFSHGPVPARPEQVVRLHHGDFALHHLVEVIEPPAREAAAGEAGGGKPQRAWVLATNVYRRTPLGWRMVAHHASPSLPPAGGPTAAPSTLH